MVVLFRGNHLSWKYTSRRVNYLSRTGRQIMLLRWNSPVLEVDGLGGGTHLSWK